jgi:hypothetical protein
MSPDPHLGFVVAAYAFAFIVVGGMTSAILVDYLTLKRSLAPFAEQARRKESGQEDPQTPESLD